MASLALCVIGIYKTYIHIHIHRHIYIDSLAFGSYRMPRLACKRGRCIFFRIKSTITIIYVYKYIIYRSIHDILYNIYKNIYNNITKNVHLKQKPLNIKTIPFFTCMCLQARLGLSNMVVATLTYHSNGHQCVHVYLWLLAPDDNGSVSVKPFQPAKPDNLVWMLLPWHHIPNVWSLVTRRCKEEEEELERILQLSLTEK